MNLTFIKNGYDSKIHDDKDDRSLWQYKINALSLSELTGQFLDKCTKNKKKITESVHN